MPRVEETALILLAAGRSKRFGGGKLAAPLAGKPLGMHVVEALADVPFACRVAVVAADCPLDYAACGYAVAVNADRDEGMGSSLRIGVAAAGDVRALVIALADMPFLSAAHVRHLFDAGDGADALVASSDGTAARPPALFGATHFDTLLRAAGDHGARDLIRSARLVVAPADELIDIDTPDDLARAATRAAARRSD